LDYHDARLLMLRKRNTDLVATAMVTYTDRVLKSGDFRVKPHGGSAMSAHEFRYLDTGSVIVTGGMDSESKVLSGQYDLVYVNEATDLTEADWETLTSRLRNGKLPFHQILGDCNPGPSAHWLNLRFPPADEATERRVRLLSRHVDNPEMWDYRRGDWTGAGRAYVQGVLADLSGAQYERLFEGKWASVEGAVYKEFSRELHVMRVDTTGWGKLAGVDVGSSNPTCVLTIRYAGDRIHVERELYRPELSSTEIVNTVAHELEPGQTVVVDPSAADYIKDWKRLGFRAEKAEAARVPEGIARVRDVLRRCLLTIDPGCKNTINEFESYAYPKNPTVSDLPKKEHDHAMDPLRYAVMRLATPPQRGGLVRSL
jgi:phage terminase large subunit